MLLSALRTLTQSRDSRWILRRLARSPHKLSKLKNLARVQWAKMRRDPTGGGGLPLIVSVEPTNSCNMRCPMCPVGLDALTRTKGMMDLERFRGLMDQLDRSTLVMTFWGWGESTLNPRLYDMIRIASERGIFTMLTMNGTNFEPHQLVDCGLDYLVISFDGLREESYGPVRVGGNLEHAIAGVRRLAEVKRQRGSSLPKMNMGFIVTRLNESELPVLEKTAEEFGFDSTRPKYLHSITKYVAEQLRPADPGNRGTVGVTGPGRSLEKDIPGIERVPIPNGCGLLWEYAMIYWDGTVAPCCYDWDAEADLGNAFVGDFRDLWGGPRYTDFRRRVSTQKHTVPLCRDCQGGDITVFFSDDFLMRR